MFDQACTERAGVEMVGGEALEDGSKLRLQALIASEHARAQVAAETDWVGRHDGRTSEPYSHSLNRAPSFKTRPLARFGGS
ncbi:MAG: hypothetical protein ACI8Y4_002635 [Candidatus Poriferisodalaceae bacterium]